MENKLEKEGGPAPKVSVIVPVYNAGRYIRECVESLTDQGLLESQYEVICVNDGSTDDSESVIKSLQCEHPSLDLVSVPNGGASRARNVGLRRARGEYVWFVDADDFVEPHCLPALIQKMDREELDFLSFGIQNYNVDGTKGIAGNVAHKPKQVVSGRDYLQYYDVECSSCTFMFRREVATKNGIFFMEGITLEDYEFPVHLLLHCRKVASVSHVLYHYRNNPKSTSRLKSEDFYTFRIACWLKILMRLSQLEKETQVSKSCLSGVKGLNAYRLLLLLLKSNLVKNTRLSYFKQLRSSGVFTMLKDKSKLFAPKHKAVATVFSSPFLYRVALMLMAK